MASDNKMIHALKSGDFITSEWLSKIAVEVVRLMNVRGVPPIAVIKSGTGYDIQYTGSAQKTNQSYDFAWRGIISGGASDSTQVISTEDWRGRFIKGYMSVWYGNAGYHTTTFDDNVSGFGTRGPVMVGRTMSDESVDLCVARRDDITGSGNVGVNIDKDNGHLYLIWDNMTGYGADSGVCVWLSCSPLLKSVQLTVP